MIKYEMISQNIFSAAEFKKLYSIDIRNFYKDL